jgi:hypothetical protein
VFSLQARAQTLVVLQRNVLALVVCPKQEAMWPTSEMRARIIYSSEKKRPATILLLILRIVLSPNQLLVLVIRGGGEARSKHQSVSSVLYLVLLRLFVRTKRACSDFLSYKLCI